MRHQIGMICCFIMLSSFKGDNSYNDARLKNRKAASSILYVNNYTTKYITGITITKASGSNYISTYISPWGYQEIDLGNTTENITVTVQLSGAISGSLQVNQYDPYYCPWLACSTFTSMSIPDIYFYMYSPRWLYVLEAQACFC